MVRKFVHEESRIWYEWLDSLWFCVREVPKASTRFSPMNYSHELRSRRSTVMTGKLDSRQFALGEKVCVILPTSSSKLLAKGQEPFLVTRQVRDLDCKIMSTDRGNSKQIYTTSISLKSGKMWSLSR